MELLIVAVIAFVVGWRISAAMQTLAFRRILSELKITESQIRKLARDNGIELPEETPTQEPAAEHEIVIEQHGSELYAFKVDGEFIGQGRDKEALVQRIAERFKNVRFTVKEGQELLQKNNS